MYEHRRDPIAPVAVFYQRILKNILIAAGIIICCLSVGIIGYHYYAHVPWVDSLHNASMILSGMGPVVVIDNTSGKIFSSCYALFSGVVFLSIVGFILAPAVHRIFHRLNHEK
jgi:hypothetical protein